jgi:hypothetical protein
VPGGQGGRPELPGVAVKRVFEPGSVEPVIGGIPSDANQGGRPELPGVAVRGAFEAVFVERMIGDIRGAAAQGGHVPGG